MCGIVGVYSFDRCPLPPSPIFRAMTASLGHRGPDHEGIWQGESLLLGHRRLSILDLTHAASQPMHRGECVLTYNGEIYNYLQLRRELQSLGATFSTESDTEVLLQAYQVWGLDCVHLLDGIFAFALWDQKQQILWLCRDRLGVKPLYFSRQAGLLRFASELRAIVTDPSFVRKVSDQAVSNYLAYGYVPAPYSIWADVQQLEPGHQLIVERSRLHINAYWTLPRPTISRRSSDELLEEFSHQFSRAVRSQTVSEREVAVLLSGGLDSAAIASVLRSGKGYCAAFQEQNFDESMAARETASRLNLEFAPIRLSNAWDRAFWELSEHLDEPFADSSALALDQLSSAVSKEVKVVLVGDGADEMLAGYATYQVGDLASLWRKLPLFLQKRIRGLVGLVPVSSTSRHPWPQIAERFWMGSECGRGFDHACWRAHLFPQMRASLYKPDWASDSEPLAEYAKLADGRLRSRLRADLQFYLPNDLLTKTDRVCMRHGLEARVPFLDHRLVEFCLSLPVDQLWSWLEPTKRKRILRRFLLPQTGLSVASRPKRGFNIPVSALMRGPLYNPLLDLVHSEPFRTEGPLAVHAVERMARLHKRGEIDRGHLLYNFLCLARWWKAWA